MARVVTEFITPTDLDDLPDGTTYKRATGTQLTKVDGVEDNATADQTGLEVQTAITGLADADKVLISSDPLTGEKRVYGIHINAAGNIETDNNDTAEA